MSCGKGCTKLEKKILELQVRLSFAEATVHCLLDELEECRIIDINRFGKRIEDLIKNSSLKEQDKK